MTPEPPNSASDDASRWRVAIVTSRYHGAITRRLREGAVHEYQRRGGRGEAVTHVEAPGTFELPLLAREAARGHDAVVAIGCVVQGETRHDEMIAGAVASGLIAAALDTGTPIALGVLTVESMAQAEARSVAVEQLCETPEDGAGKRVVSNKGVEAMAAALEAAGALARARSESAGRS